MPFTDRDKLIWITAPYFYYVCLTIEIGYNNAITVNYGIRKTGSIKVSWKQVIPDDQLTNLYRQDSIY